ncbi:MULTISPECIES: DMT family transporter [Salipiger]|jgi:drug/metabolite transporter (DMT)-like permease|nr:MULTISPECIES: DMT family transporter [Salipiger]SFB92607.1 Threonine/homoserine efflux transporter RhtA [Salipiger profundus]
MATPAENVSSPLRGALWMVVTGLCFVAVTALVKLLAGRVPAAESAFLRYVFGLLILLPAWRELAALRLSRRQLGLTVLRGVAQTGGVLCWFFAMTRIPIAEVTAMNYLTPVYVTILAALVLGERLAIRRIMAIGAALAGALLILRPGFRELDPGHFAMLGTALLFSVSYLIAKIISGEMSAAAVVVLLSISVALGLFPFAMAVWVTPSWGDLAILVAVAGFATGGHYAMTLAFAAAPVTVTQPVTFLQLVWSVLVGALFFGEGVDLWVVAGGTVIMGAVLFITWREAMLKRKVAPRGPEAQS